MVDESVTRALKALGLILRTDKDSRTLGLVKAVLGKQKEQGGSLSIHEIHDELRREEPGVKLSKTFVQKTLRTAVEAGFVRATGHGPQRIRYSSDASAVETGLHRTAESAKRRIQQEIRLINPEFDAAASLDCTALAQDVVLEFTGSKQRISSRLVIGAEDIRRAVGYNMKDTAGEGSIIRVAAMSPSPFIHQNGEVVPEIAHAVLRGSNVRCLVSSKIAGGLFQIDGREDNHEDAFDSLQSPRVAVKVYDGPMMYHQVTLNNDCMALIVSEKPLMAAWITRHFNPDIIDASVLSFDESWKEARALHAPCSKGASGSS